MSYHSSVLKENTVKEINEFMERYNTLSDYAQKKLTSLPDELYTAQEAKCDAFESGFLKGDFFQARVSRYSNILYAILHITDCLK